MDLIKVKEGYVEHTVIVGHCTTEMILKEVWKTSLSMKVIRVDLNTALKNSKMFDALLTDYESIHKAKFTGEAVVSFSTRR